MNQQQTKWKETCNRFVGFFDIMGFKDRMLREGHFKVEEMMRNLELIILPIREDEKTLVKPLIFSDSIVITTQGDTEMDLSEIAGTSSWLMDQCLKLSIPLKGAISYGLYTADFDSSLHFGQPLIDAYLLQDEMQIYACAIDHTVEAFVQSKNLSERFFSENFNFVTQFVKYVVPMKGCKVNHYLLNPGYGITELSNEIKGIEGLYSTVSGKVRIYLDNTLSLFSEISKYKLEAQKESLKYLHLINWEKQNDKSST